MDKYYGSISQKKLEELGWYKDHEFASTMQKDDFILDCWQIGGVGKMDILLSIKDNINGKPIQRSIEDWYRDIYRGDSLVEEQLENLIKI